MFLKFRFDIVCITVSPSLFAYVKLIIHNVLTSKKKLEMALLACVNCVSILFNEN